MVWKWIATKRSGAASSRRIACLGRPHHSASTANSRLRSAATHTRKRLRAPLGCGRGIRVAVLREHGNGLMLVSKIPESNDPGKRPPLNISSSGGALCPE
jgi:hypothetical protein